MPRFAKGNKLGNGRPKGSKNKNCMSPVFWYNLIEEKTAGMPPDRIIAIAFKALELLMPKVNNIPNTPEDSYKNAIEAQLLLKSLETDDLADTQPTPAGD